jgi:sulfate adenylyltransferase subunit 2
VVPLYFAAPRLVVDDERFAHEPGERVATRTVRFHTLGCYPLIFALESGAATVVDIVDEMRAARLRNVPRV